MAANLEQFVSQCLTLHHGTPVEHLLEPLQRDVIKLGIDPRASSGALLKIATEVDQLQREIDGLAAGVKLKSATILALCLFFRFCLTGMLADFDVGVADAAAAAAAALSLTLGVALQLLLLKTLPRLWTCGPGAEQVSQTFTNWCALLILDEFTNPPEQSSIVPGWRDLLANGDQLKRLEWRDGICRRDEREFQLVRWAGQQLTRSRAQLARTVMFLPVSELLLAVVLGIGLCGYPAAQMMQSNSVMASGN